MSTVHTTAALLERMAYHTDHPIEMTSGAAFLTIGRTTFTAPLAPVQR